MLVVADSDRIKPMTRTTGTLGAALVLLASLFAPFAQAGTAYTYDALGRVISVRQDDGKQTVYVYDAAGNRVQTIVSGNTLNRAPIAAPDGVTLFENQSTITLDPTLNDTDPDGTPLALYSVAAGSLGTTTKSGNTLTYTSSYKRNGQEPILYTVTDGQGMSASGQVTVTLANQNPTAVNDNIQSPINFGRVFDPTRNDTDPGGDRLVVTAVSVPAHGTATVSAASGGVIYVPVANYAGPDAFTYSISDGDGGTAVANVSMSVTATPPPPPVANADTVVLQGAVAIGDPASIVFDPRINDTDPLGEWLRIIAVTQPLGGSAEIVSNGTQIRITTLGNSTVSALVGSMSYTISDGLGRQTVGTIASSVQWH